MTRPSRKPKAANQVNALVRREAGLSLPLLGDIRALIEITRSRVAAAVNSELALLYWRIGRRIRQDILHDQRADYGQRVVDALSSELTVEYGKGFTPANLFHMVRFAEVYPDEQIVYALRRELSWTHLRLDLLFYHRRLRRLVAIDLKLGRFQAADKGQMELYLRWLDEHDRSGGEDSPIGLILCAGKSEEHVRLLKLEESHIRVAEYLTELPPRELLERKLLQAIQAARHRLEGGGEK